MSFSICSSDSILAESSWSTGERINLCALSLAGGCLPSPSFSRDILEVENAAYRGFETAFQGSCDTEERWTIDDICCGNLVEGFRDVRKSVRESVLKDSIAPMRRLEVVQKVIVVVRGKHG